MEKSKKNSRYRRIFEQLQPLMRKSSDPLARMATIAAVLHYKMDYFFWTGFYLLLNGELVVQVYQGPLACLVLQQHTGVCWAAIDGQQSVVVSDIHLFPGHIACDSRSLSEIVIPVRNYINDIIGVLDVDSE
ncbi:MAG: GAF domain-containing protein, partial [Bacteroidota bacterium]